MSGLYKHCSLYNAPVIVVWMGRHIEVCIIERVAVGSCTIQAFPWVLDTLHRA